MAGTLKKKFTFSAPLPLPLQVKVEFWNGGNKLGEQLKTISAFGEFEFALHVPGTTTDAGTTTKILYADGPNWNPSVSQRIPPYAFNFPFCFSGFKIGLK